MATPHESADPQGEALSAFAKVEPLLDDMRELVGSPDFLKNLQSVTNDWPGAAERMAHLREMLREAGAAQEG